MFSICRSFVRAFVVKLVNTIFRKWMNRFWCQLAQTVHRASGAHKEINFGGQEVKGQGHTRPTIFEGLAETSFSVPLGRVSSSKLVWTSHFYVCSPASYRVQNFCFYFSSSQLTKQVSEWWLRGCVSNHCSKVTYVAFHFIRCRGGRSGRRTSGDREGRGASERVWHTSCWNATFRRRCRQCISISCSVGAGGSPPVVCDPTDQT